MPRFREGDLVSLKATVRFDQDVGDDMVHVAVEGGISTKVRAEDATMVLGAFQSGDLVTWGVRSNVGIVRSTVGSGLDTLLWVRLPNGKMETIDAYRCQRAEDVTEAELLAGIDGLVETPPAPADPADTWTVHDPELGTAPVIPTIWLIDVKFKDGTHGESMPAAIVDWSKVIAYRDAEIPF